MSNPAIVALRMARAVLALRRPLTWTSCAPWRRSCPDRRLARARAGAGPAVGLRDLAAAARTPVHCRGLTRLAENRSWTLSQDGPMPCLKKGARKNAPTSSFNDEVHHEYGNRCCFTSAQACPQASCCQRDPLALFSNPGMSLERPEIGDAKRVDPL